MTIGIAFILGAFILFFAGLPIFSVIGLGALAVGLISPVPIVDSLGMTAWAQSQNYVLISVPLFIMLGEIFVRSGIAGEMYDAVAPWLNKMPGRLMQTNVATSAIFAATSGSSLATAATIGSIAIPQIKLHGYNERLFLGSIAAGGTLGILIPPSINLIVYGSITNTSIPELYLAGIVPGLILTALFMLVTTVLCIMRPEWSGEEIKTDWRMRIATLPKLLPPLGLFLVVVGSIYAGIATPTEAAALGVIATLVLGLARGRMSFRILNSALLATAKTNAILMIIIIFAALLNFALGLIGFSRLLESFVLGLELSTYSIVLLVVLIYLILGCFLEGLSLTVLTVPVLAPIMAKLGFDPVWFGIMVILVTEAGLITPPVGMNCYVVQATRGRGSLMDVFIGVSPYLLALLTLVGIIIVWPEVALWYR
ncbi:TRAP transporter large permease [Bordetella sp. BOR01]|uniref:TRAP transporter large permease n=1 Tax=Bordetella sp. BOR01 TaxID=2854779 RepID=UPI001C4465D4|nr:TRAP transporter large permease [Bordetella sp. BOR01]MBV7483812.1 TRAP transporter large permease [Bordetella sp. BOR01]